MRIPTPSKAPLANTWRPAFLAALRETGNIRASCRVAGIDRRAVMRAYKSSLEFHAEWEKAMEEATDALEIIARRRAVDSSDTLLIFLLKALDPQKYREGPQVVINQLIQDFSGKLDSLLELLYGEFPDPVSRRKIDRVLTQWRGGAVAREIQSSPRS